MRTLQILINSHHVATLSDNAGVWSLEYTPAWIARPDGYDLSPALPRAKGLLVDGSSERPVQWFFDNLLPEEQARTLLASDAKLEFADAFGLLSYYGSESAGAITLLPEPQLEQASGLNPISDAQLSERIRNLPRVALTTGAPKRMSLAGAQHKLPIVMEKDALFEPIGNTPSTHILKPDHPDRNLYDATAVNEWFVMSVARAVGLQVPDVKVRRVPEAAYLIERFDRTRVNDRLKRVHALDACQLLTLDKSFKYQQATAETLRKILGQVRNVAQTRLQLFRWLVFNIVVGNNDAHLKNLSFFVRPDAYYLAPHYDLLCTAVYGESAAPWLEAELVWKPEGVRTHADITRASVISLGEAIGVRAPLGNKIIDELVPGVEDAARDLLEKNVHAWHAGESRLVRRIVHGVIRDMTEKLRP
ncbi:HipA domain-containing protein [Pseudomonas kermanshahensis]|uniref:HipA domain-containing protein n=1 Tax=Pseudomonas kermanshahensis TaxID=2745482 RepID=UPI0023D97E96|nr:HipA domain-containing protein [Pseudomonas kermanshahensis]WEL55786.1 HipA domain-containing protein [Pseudomonas kermanshahensis]